MASLGQKQRSAFSSFSNSRGSHKVESFLIMSGSRCSLMQIKSLVNKSSINSHLILRYQAIPSPNSQISPKAIATTNPNISRGQRKVAFLLISKSLSRHNLCQSNSSAVLLINQAVSSPLTNQSKARCTNPLRTRQLTTTCLWKSTICLRCSNNRKANRRLASIGV